MKLSTKLNAWALAVIIVAAGIADAQARKPTATVPSKIEVMLKEIKAIYQPVKGEKAFTVSFSGDVMTEIELFVVETEGGMAVLVDIATAKDVDLTPAVLRRLLEYSSQVDFIKVGISEDGSVRVQTEQNLEGMKSKDCKALLDQMAAGANDVAKILASVRTKPAGK